MDWNARRRSSTGVLLAPFNLVVLICLTCHADLKAHLPELCPGMGLWSNTAKLSTGLSCCVARSRRSLGRRCAAWIDPRGRSLNVNRRTRVGHRTQLALLATLCVSWLSLCQHVLAQAPARKPNIVIIWG